MTERLPLPAKEELVTAAPIVVTMPSLIFERDAETVRRIPITLKPEPRYSITFLGVASGAMIVAIAFAISFAVACAVT